MDESRLSSVTVWPGGVAEVEATSRQPDRTVLSVLRRGDVSALRIRNLTSAPACDHLTARLATSDAVVEHADVDGLRVVGLSHFQAARDPELRPRYSEEARTTAGALRALSSPYASPFDSAVAFLMQSWPAGCQVASLPTEGLLAPFTVRVYQHGVGIEPHQDILSAESPTDPEAASIKEQFGANIYLSMGTSGGALEIFSAADSVTAYKDLSDGPQVVARDRLSDPEATITPNVGDLIIFPTRRVHAVEPSQGSIPRITISFFVGVRDEHLPLWIWA